jgi:hypothetical protein
MGVTGKERIPGASELGQHSGQGGEMEREDDHYWLGSAWTQNLVEPTGAVTVHLSSWAGVGDNSPAAAAAAEGGATGSLPWQAPGAGGVWGLCFW